MVYLEPCIYRVPSRMREAKPEAYTPRMVLIGPLHHSSKPIADNDADETSSYPWHIGEKKKKKYQKMEEQKKIYLERFTEKFGSESVEEMRKTIQSEETRIRGSYAESIEWMSSEFLVDLILQDSVFIVEFIIRILDQDCREFSCDLTTGHPIYNSSVVADLILLENQLPYFIFDKLFGPYMTALRTYKTLDRLILEFFSLHTKIKRNTKFMHFTDMFRCVYEQSLDQTPSLVNELAIVEMQNADNLSRAGVEFKAFDFLNSSKQEELHRQFSRFQRVESLLPISIIKEVRDEYSLHVTFKNGNLVMSSFRADEASDIILRNVIAYEQCHLGLEPFTSNYIHFMNFLITSDKDVEVLTTEEVLTNGMGRPGLVVEMVNKLKVGVDVADSSQYHGVAMINLKAHYQSRSKRCWATLNKVYFSDLWTGTATVAAALLLFFTLVGSVASVIVQTYKAFK